MTWHGCAAWAGRPSPAFWVTATSPPRRHSQPRRDRPTTRPGSADAASAFDLVEVTDATPYSELLAYESLSLCPRQDWAARAADGSFASGGRLPVNLSGGVLTWNPVFCTGLIRIAEVANQIRGRAGAHQVPNASCGLAHAGSGFAMQYQAAVVLAREARP